MGAGAPPAGSMQALMARVASPLPRSGAGSPMAGMRASGRASAPSPCGGTGARTSRRASAAGASEQASPSGRASAGVEARSSGGATRSSGRASGGSRAADGSNVSHRELLRTSVNALRSSWSAAQVCEAQWERGAWGVGRKRECRTGDESHLDGRQIVDGGLRERSGWGSSTMGAVRWEWTSGAV